MPEFAFQALTPTGEVLSGVAPAQDERDLAEQIRRQGQYLVRAQARVPAERPRVTDTRVASRELVAFTEYLLGCVDAGLPLMETLSDARQRMASRRFRDIIGEMSQAVAERGKTLSEAMAEHPRAFPRLYVGTVAAGEASGHLPFALSELLKYLDWQQEIASEIRQALAYPAIVVAGVFALIGILVGFVYPRLVPILTSIGKGPLPLPTRIIMGGAGFLRHWWLLLLGILALAAGGVWLLRRTTRGRLWLDGLLLRLPIFGPVVREIQMARFVTYTALFYRTGVDLMHGLTLVQEMIPNRVVAAAIREARAAVADGESMATAFGRIPLFPPLVVRSVALGEATGGLDEALTRAKRYYDREVPAAVKRLVAALQPLLIVFLGGMILLVALSILLPILNIYKSIGH